jgi:uncharacterized lipoprotein YmbA
MIDCRCVISLALLAAGCGLLRPTPSTPTRFYVLDATATADGTPAERRLTLGLGPLSLPPYLERPEMVRRVSENQLTFDEFNRWGEPLKANLQRVLATNLDALVGVERLMPYPWYSNAPIDFSVAVAVLRFEPQPDGNVALDARWNINAKDGTVLLSRESHLNSPGGSPAETAAAMSSLAADLSREMAAGLRQVDSRR